MIQRVMNNVAVPGAHYILLVLRKHLDSHRAFFANLAATHPCSCVPVNAITEGAACTALLARQHLENDAPLLIANSDQLVDIDVAEFVRDAQRRSLDASILVFRATHPKYSFARVEGDRVVETREKQPISDLATVGLYYFARGREFVAAADAMIAANDRFNGEFYICPSYNYLIARGGRVGVFEIAPTAMHGLGTPEELTAYLNPPAP